MSELKSLSDYSQMQKDYYAKVSAASKYDQDVKTDHVVGTYHAHNEWADYDRFLMRGIDESYKDKIALDFGCGPGRNIVKYQGKFARIDGCDIDPGNLENARINFAFHKIELPNLYVTNGNDLGGAPSNTYDLIFSTICMQHICVHAIRYSILQNMYRALKQGGRISIQMGFGKNSPKAVPYHANFTQAEGTNRSCDTMIENPDFVENDLLSIGFKDFDYWVRPVGPGDMHPYWIFFTASK